MPRGGKRPGAGRPVSEATKKRRDIAEKALEMGVTPLDVMLGAMREALGPDPLKPNWAAAQVFARDAAPYVHPKLAATEVKMEADVVTRGDFSELTPEEWERAQQGLAPAIGAAEKSH